jgi:hypothetical protein
MIGTWRTISIPKRRSSLILKAPLRKKTELGLNRESLYKSLSRDGNPSFATIVKVIDMLGYKIEIRQKTA